jgi:hypothetical protein
VIFRATLRGMSPQGNDVIEVMGVGFRRSTGPTKQRARLTPGPWNN